MVYFLKVGYSQSVTMKKLLWEACSDTNDKIFYADRAMGPLIFIFVIVVVYLLIYFFVCKIN